MNSNDRESIKKEQTYLQAMNQSSICESESPSQMHRGLINMAGSAQQGAGGQIDIMDEV